MGLQNHFHQIRSNSIKRLVLSHIIRQSFGRKTIKGAKLDIQNLVFFTLTFFINILIINKICIFLYHGTEPEKKRIQCLTSKLYRNGMKSVILLKHCSVQYKQVVIVCQLDLELHMQSVPITTESYEFESRSWRGVRDTILCDKVFSEMRQVGCFLPVLWFLHKKTYPHDIADILLKVG